MVETRGSTPLAGKQEEEGTSGHKRNPEEVESCEDVTGLGAHGLPLGATATSGFLFLHLFG